MGSRNLLLMVVAVGCGLGAAILTTRISAKPKIELIDVYVAAKNLPVGTVLTREELPKAVARKAVPKEAVPPMIVLNEEDLLDRRLTRSIQAGEYITSNALTKGGVITLPDGHDMVTMPINIHGAVAGFVGPGSRVDVLASLKLGNEVRAFPLLVNVLVLAVDRHASYDSANNKGGGVFTEVSSVSFAVTQEQALVLKMAEHRGCYLSLLLRNPNKKDPDNYNIEEVKKLLQAERYPGKLVSSRFGNDGADDAPDTQPPATAPSPTETVKVWIAKNDLSAGTLLTKDLVEKEFEQKDLPKEYAEGAVTDLTPVLGQLALKNGISKSQWLTAGMLGPPPVKPGPREEFVPPKPDLGRVPAASASPGPAGQRPVREVVVHTANRSEIYRYEEVRPGQWRFKEKVAADQGSGGDSGSPTPAPTPPVQPSAGSVDPNSGGSSGQAGDAAEPGQSDNSKEHPGRQSDTPNQPGKRDEGGV